MFIFSTLYKDNFWANYYDGIHVFFLFLLIIPFYYLKKLNIPTLNGVRNLLIILLIINAVALLYNNFKSPYKRDGLARQQAIVDYVINQQKKQPKPENFCVRVYTPPVVPYTYQYLFLYQKMKKVTNIVPLTDMVNNQCWYIIENDDNKERINMWLKENIAKTGKKIVNGRVDDVNVFLLKN